MKKRNILLGSILLIQILIFSYFVSLNGMLIWDEVVYLSNARDKVSHSYFTEEFRFPLLSTIISIIWMVTGESILVVQITMIIIALLTTLTFYFVARHFLDEKLALLATFLLAFSSQYIYWGFRIYTDLLGLLLILLSFLMFLNYKQKNLIHQNKLIFFAGLFAGLAFVARLSTIIIAIPIAAFFLLNKNWNNTLKYTIGFLVALLPWMIEGLIKANNPLNFVSTQTSAILEYTTREPANIFLSFLINEFGVSLILIGGIITYFVNFQKNKKRSFKLTETNKKVLLLLLILITQLIFYIGFVKLKLARYIIELTPFIILLIILGFEGILKITSKKYKPVIITILIIITLSMVLPAYQTISDTKEELKCTSTGALQQSIQVIKEKTEPGQAIVSSVWPYYGYYANLKAYSSWNEDIDYYFKKYEPDYFILSNKVGVTFEEEVNHPNLTKIAELTDSCGWDLTIYEVN